MMCERKAVGGDKLNPPIYIVEFDGKNVKSISVNSATLKAHFEADQWVYDFHRYIQISQKDLNEIGMLIVDNEGDWSVLNNIHDKLWGLRCKHFDKVLDNEGILKKHYNNYSVIAYRCMPFVHRKFKTMNYINQLLGVYANQL